VEGASSGITFHRQASTRWRNKKSKKKKVTEKDEQAGSHPTETHKAIDTPMHTQI